MGKVYCIGETVCDIIFKNGNPVAAKAGGSMLNSSVSMGRTGLPVSFISEYANDQLGQMIDDFLKDSGIDTSNIFRYDNGKTSVALAFLNEKNNASYSFYKHLPQERLAIQMPDFTEDDVLLFGSFYAINKEIRPTVVELVTKAKKAGAVIIYDPNFRKAHLHELSDLMPYIIENMQMASIIRGSNEDFEMIFGSKTIADAYNEVSKYCKNLLYTENEKGFYIQTPSVGTFIPVDAIVPVSTIGAGDNFNAGFIYGIYKAKVKNAEIERFTSSQWNEICHYAPIFAKQVCKSYDNYLSKEFAASYKL
ncbi:MAG TPA: PfkB family carbohydrate kinase [Bacteroidales bacterium]|nr:PfkB family carbohydrate kinase [Bacteroidales bacterium]